MVNLRCAEFDEPRVSSPGTLALTYLEQPVRNVPGIASDDDALDFHALACKGVFIVGVTIVKGDAAGVPHGGGHAWRPRSWSGRCATGAHIQPGLVKLSNQGAEGGAEVINRGGDPWATRDAADDKSGNGDPKGRAEAQATASNPRGGLPPGMILQLITMRSAH